MDNQSQVAAEKFREGYNCAQSVLLALNMNNDISQEALVKIATGFGAGMGREQDVCGAVSGGIMSLGLKYGMNTNSDKSNKDLTYSKTSELIQRFEEKFGTIKCIEILDGCDLKTVEGRDYFVEHNFSETKCIECVKFAASVCAGL